MPDKLSLTVIY